MENKMDKYKQYIDLQWWMGIEKRTIENWIKNFGANEDLAQFILDSVIFYNAQQLRAYTLFLINRLREQIYMDGVRSNGYGYCDDTTFYELWHKYLDMTKFLPAALKNDPASSAHKVLGYWRSGLGDRENRLSTIDAMGDDYKNGIRRFVLVDDFSGSGRQMTKVLEQEITIEGQKVKLGHLPEIYEDVEIIVAVYVIHEKAKLLLEENYSSVRLLYVDLIDENLSYLNKDALLYEKLGDGKAEEYIVAMKKITDSLIRENEDLKELSAYVLNIPIVFEHGCPNNTLLLLFAHATNWQQLFKRGNEL